jgi:putative restriction endonuclease
MYNSENDFSIRSAAFEWLNNLVQVHGNLLTYDLLKNGFIYKDEKINVVGATGIWKPRQCNYPISILTSVNGPYNDAFRDDNFILYNYRGTNADHHNNVGLRNALKEKVPLIYFLGISKNRYMPIYPIFIQHDDPQNLNILLQVDLRKVNEVQEFHDVIKDPVRDYITVEVKRRIHQEVFRENVLKAYKCQCSFCNIKHEILLDAAHIISDKKVGGEPVISNGLALCKIHHAAFDANLMGVSPDYIIKVNNRLLEEIDGPMLQHGIKELNNRKLLVPSKKDWQPDPDRLMIRYKEFKVA